MPASRAGRAYYMYVYADGRKKHILRSRKMMEDHLGRTLHRDEHVDHINEDPTDDRLENLQVLSAREHAIKTLTGRPNPLKGVEKGWSHGTMYGWMRKKCKCKKCIAAKNRHNAERRAKRKLQG